MVRLNDYFEKRHTSAGEKRVCKAPSCHHSYSSRTDGTRGQDAVHTKKRNRLLDESVQRELFVKFNHRALNREQHFQLRSSTLDLSPDKDFFEQPESDDESIDGAEPMELDDAPAAAAAASSSSAAAAASAPIRTQSDIDDGMRAFLESYIDSHGITLTNCRIWRNDRRNPLESALLAHGRGGYTTDDAIKAIKQILAEQH